MIAQQKDLTLLSHQLQRKVSFVFTWTVVETIIYDFCFIFFKILPDSSKLHAEHRRRQSV